MPILYYRFVYKSNRLEISCYYILMHGYSIKTMLVAFALLWSFGSGILITKIFLDTRTPFIVQSTSRVFEPIQSEYHIVAVTDTDPKIVVVYEYVTNTEQNSRRYYGTVHLTQYDAALEQYQPWENGRMEKDDLYISDTDSRNNLENTLISSVELNNKIIKLEVPSVKNYLPIRSEQSFTKFLGVGKGHLFVDEVSYPATVASTKGFNNKYTNIDILELGVSTEWFLFFDSENRIYHLDYTNVEKFHPAYKSHKYFGMLNTSGLSGHSVATIYGDSASVTSTTDFVRISLPEYGFAKSFSYGPIYYSDPAEIYLNRLIYNNAGDLGIYLSIK